MSRPLLAAVVATAILATTFVLDHSAAAPAGQVTMLSVTKSEPSPHRDFLIEEYMREISGGGPEREVWLVDARDTLQRKLLYRHSRHVELKFSDDEQWLVINDHCASGEARILLFKRKATLDYDQVTDLTDGAWDHLMLETGHKGRPNLDHQYADVLAFEGGDEPVLLIQLRGHLDEKNHVRGALCLYDIKSKVFSTDLAAFNKRQVKQE